MRFLPRTLLVALAALALAALVAALSANAVASSAASSASATRLNSLEAGVVAEINELRRRHGLAPLRSSGALSAAAHAHSRAMARAGFFSHKAPNGSAFWQRVRRFYSSGGFSYWSVGENLLWSSPDIDAERAVRMWLDSPPHRRNMLTAVWREIGLAALYVNSAPGVFGGQPVTIVTADFGVRR